MLVVPQWYPILSTAEVRQNRPLSADGVSPGLCYDVVFFSIYVLVSINEVPKIDGV